MSGEPSREINSPTLFNLSAALWYAPDIPTQLPNSTHFVGRRFLTNLNRIDAQNGGLLNEQIWEIDALERTPTAQSGRLQENNLKLVDFALLK